MSGFEIAGLVLGALPLLISAIEHYDSTLDRLTAFFKWEDELKKFLRELWVQYTSLEMTLRGLLKEVASPVEAEEMMLDFRHDLWSSRELAESLEDKLKAAYGVYVYTIKEMESYMVILANHLDIDRQGGTSNELEAIILANPPLPSSIRQPHKFEFQRRVKLTMKRKGIRRLLASIKSCNERLDQFIEKAEKYEQPAPQTSSWKSSLSLSLQQIQEYAISLHQALSSAWSCSVHAPHDVLLLLEHRMVRQKQKKLRAAQGEDEPACFTMSFRSPSTPRNWHLAEFRIIERPLSTTRVRFQIPTAANATPSPIGALGPSNMTQLGVVNDLCSIFCNQPHPIPCFGFGLEHQGTIRGTYQAVKAPVGFAETSVSLENVLLSVPKTKRWQPLTVEDRYILATTLASSFLQLHTTPWLSGYWCKQDIVFSELLDGASHLIDIRKPFILKAYECKGKGSLGSGSGTNTSTWSIQSDKINVLTLAKVLLEINGSDRIEHLRQDEPVGKNGEPNFATDLQTLNQWIRQEKGNLSFAYRDAVACCMKCSVDPNFSLRDPMCRQSMVDGVVVPLLKELHYWQDGVVS
ncbi:Fc.00g027850.m01.CDS01 [Cosmosporella sp. VM-42]